MSADAPGATAEVERRSSGLPVGPSQQTVKEAGPREEARVNSDATEINSNTDDIRQMLARVLQQQAAAATAAEAVQDQMHVLQNQYAMGRSPASSMHEDGPRFGRRSSLLHAPMETVENTVLKVQKEIPEDLKIRKLTFKAVILAEKNMWNWISMNQDPTKKFQDFFTPNVLQQLVNNEQRLQRPMYEFVSLATLHEAKPATVLDMATRLLRPTTTAEYQLAVYETVFEPKPYTKGWIFGFESYDKEMHAPMSKMVEQSKALLVLINLNVNEEESALWPKPEWGSKTKPGLIRIYSRTLGKYEENFNERIGESNLKAMKSVTEYFDAVTKVNHELANMARTLTAKKSLFYKAPSLEESYALAHAGAQDQKTQASFLAGKSYNQTPSGTPLAPARANHDTRDRRPEYHQNSNNAGRGQPYNRLRDLEAELRSPDDTANLAQVYPVEGEDSDEELYQSTLYELMGTPSHRPSGQLFQGKVSPRPAASTLPCFAEARGEPHDAKTCAYSHDPQVYKEAMRRRVEDICATLGKTWLLAEIDKLDIKGNRTPRYSDAPVRSVTANYHEKDPAPSSMPPTPAQIYPMSTRRFGDDSKVEGSRFQEWNSDS